MKTFILEGGEVVAPSLFLAEISCAFWKYARTGTYSDKQCRQFIKEAKSLIDRFIPLDDFPIEAFSEGIHLKHSPYDMFYLVLARRCGATLLTMGKNLVCLCDQQGIDCVYQIEI